MNRAEQQLMELLDCVVDGSASDAERRRFAQLVEGRHELAAELVEQLRMHSLLQWKSDHLNNPAFNCGPTPPDTYLASSEHEEQASRSRWRWAIAAMLLLSAGAGILFMQGLGHVGRTPIAEIVRDQDTRWNNDSAANIQGKFVYSSNLDLISGTTSLRLPSGATLSLVGPVSMHIDSGSSVQIDRGKVMAEVPHTIKGFAVQTPSAMIIDRGTRFQVDSHEDGGTDVAVFDGAVDVQSADMKATLKTCLTQQEAARLDRQGNIVRLIHFEQEPMNEQWKEVRPLPAITIRGAWDNVWSTKEDSHYLINARGLADDCRAYVDHPHEWNGMTSDGLPKFLQYADFVRTFNDYRYMNELELSVDLARPAWLYVIFDDRSPIPAWLKEQFEDTGVKVGLDEGPWEGTPNLSVAVGPGKSIDTVFTVFRRRCDKPGVIKLGPMAKGSEARAMYGVAAKPLD
jgi:FecR protein